MAIIYVSDGMGSSTIKPFSVPDNMSVGELAVQAQRAYYLKEAETPDPCLFFQGSDVAEPPMVIVPSALCGGYHKARLFLGYQIGSEGEGERRG